MLQHLMFSRFSAERAAPPGCTHAAARTAGAWRCGTRAARFRPRFRFLAPPGLDRHGLPPRPALAAALRPPRCPRLDPAFIWLTAPFSSAPPESQNNWSRAGAGKETESRKGGGGAR